MLEKYIALNVEIDKQFGNNLSGMSQCHQPAGGGTKVLFKKQSAACLQRKMQPGPETVWRVEASLHCVQLALLIVNFLKEKIANSITS